ncbi:serine/threonine-protein kinase [Candidatus Protofrankia californiensis]|uniref:serine/threonine-protein kinase n=1 Tax=Candidatus Protofrankia californiensis TaxID=1839754 RepID=UPI0013EBDE75|nr:serine/threonine protein kinase [Candidatus Protofrankia californiensis]
MKHTGGDVGKTRAGQGTAGASPGPVIEGYRDFRRIAIGGFSTVYTAYQERFARTVAVKVLGTDIGDADALRRFTRECQASGRLSHLPEIVTVYDAGATADDQPFIAMQYFPRGSLVDRIRDNNQLSVPEAVGVGVSVARALAAAHRAGITHRDVKPGNLLVSDEGGAVLSDFGVASVVTGPEKSVSLDAYTPVHCAPEVLDGQRYSPSADVYALGSTLYTLLAGTAPFAPRAGDGPATVMRRILAGDATELDQGVPEPLRVLIGRMMSVDPHQRPTAVSLVEESNALQDVLGTEPLARPEAAGEELAADPPSSDTPASDTPAAGEPETSTGSGAAAAGGPLAAATRRRSRAAPARSGPQPAPAGAGGTGSQPAAPGYHEPLDTPTRIRPRGTPLPVSANPASADKGSDRRRLQGRWITTVAGVVTMLVISGALAVALWGRTDSSGAQADNVLIPSGAAPSTPGGTDPAPSGQRTSVTATTSPTPTGFGPGPADAAPANPDSLRPPTSPATPTAPTAGGPASPPPQADSAPVTPPAPSHTPSSVRPSPQPAPVGGCSARSETSTDYAGRTFSTRYYCGTYAGSAVYANVRSNQASEALDDSGYMAAATNVWVLCQYQGRSNPVIQGNTNTWWLYTQADDGRSNTHGYTAAWGYLPATAVSQGGQNEPVPGVPSCPSYF